MHHAGLALLATRRAAPALAPEVATRVVRARVALQKGGAGDHLVGLERAPETLAVEGATGDVAALAGVAQLLPVPHLLLDRVLVLAAGLAARRAAVGHPGVAACLAPARQRGAVRVLQRLQFGARRRRVAAFDVGVGDRALQHPHLRAYLVRLLVRELECWHLLAQRHFKRLLGLLPRPLLQSRAFARLVEVGHQFRRARGRHPMLALLSFLVRQHGQEPCHLGTSLVQAGVCVLVGALERATLGQCGLGHRLLPPAGSHQPRWRHAAAVLVPHAVLNSPVAARGGVAEMRPSLSPESRSPRRPVIQKGLSPEGKAGKAPGG